MAIKMKKKDIENFINSKKVTQDTYQAPTVKVHEANISNNVNTTINKPTLKELKTISTTAEKNFDKADNIWKNKVIENRNDRTKQKFSYETKNNQDNTGLALINDNKDAFNKASEEYNNRENARNKYALADYLYNKEKYNEENYNPGFVQSVYDKSIGRGLRAAGDMLLNFGGRDNEKYVDEKGNVTYLPSALALKNEAVKKTYGNNLIGKASSTLGDVMEGVGKIGTATALDAVTGGVGGTLAYNNDMAKSAYKNAINQGASEKQALANAGIETAAELATGKMLGSATKGLTKLGGNTLAETEAGSAFEKLLEKQIGKKISNKTASKLLSSGLSEATEEGLQEYISALNNKLTLGQDIDLKETTKNAGYSALVGGLTGAAINTPGVVRNSKISDNVDALNFNQQANEVRNQDIANASDSLNLGKYNDTIVNEFNGYTNKEINNIQSDNIKIANSENDIVEFAKNVKNKKDTFKKLYVGKVKQNISNFIKEKLGVDIGGYNISIGKNSLEHSINHHGSETELLRGQVPITENDFKNIPTIINEADNIHRGHDTKENKPSITFEKNIDGNNVVVTYVSDKHHNLELQTMYKFINNKKINSVTAVNEYNPLTSTSETNSDTNLFNENIPQTNQNVNLGISNNSNMQQNQNNSQELNNSSFSMEEYEKYKDLKTLDDAGMLDSNEIDEFNILSSKYKNAKVKYENLNTNNKFEDTKSDYLKYSKDKNSFNPDLMNNALNVIEANKQGKRTKEQWLDVAKNIGENYKGNEEGLKEYAYKSWLELSPNRKEQLNRQGKKYVGFGTHEWVNEVYKGAGVGQLETTNNNSIKDRNNSDILYESKEPDDILVIKNNIKEKPLNSKTTSDEINYVLNGDKGESKFFKNITENSKFIDKENRNKLSKENNIKFYDKVTNEESLQEAQEKLDNMGENAIVDFFSDKKEVDSVDVATGWILLKRFQDVGDYESMVEVAKKMRTMGTKSGQAIQTFNIMSRLTPEGMVKYAQSELMEAYDKFSENKSKKWIDENRDDFGLTPEETQFIVDTMKKVETMEDGYPKKVELAKIQKMLQDKLPPEKGQGIKSWMRISMLFNPKTQIRNIVGNAAITPVNAVADVFSATTDKILAKKTGVRTTGMANIGAYLKGSKQGIYESTNDFKLGINTKDVNQNRFEVGQGKAFNEKMKGIKSIFNPVAKAGNKVDSMLNYALDVGDRAFSQGAFEQSIKNQMILNNTTEITQDMIDIAEQEALSRTWNDDNSYTKFVLDIRRGLNKIGPKSYGLGDVLIPFAKTPANLTKAIVDYSPVGVVNTLLDVRKVKNNIETGRFTPQMQHEFVQKLGKATAGTILYILGYALAKSKITSGNSDDDKDVADFMRNTLGIQPYSIKIGDKSFTYDWAQPVAAPLAIMADLEKQREEDKKQKLHDAISSVADTGFNLLMEQSFMQSINEVLSGYGSTFEKIEEQALGLPARSTPTFLKQINDMIDSKNRMVYEQDSKSESAVNQVKTKISGLSKSLPVKRDTLGRKVEKYGGDNNAFNIFINPANINKGKVSESAKEIYAVYEATKDKKIMPREPDSKLNLNNKDKSKFLKISGNIIDENVKSLKNDDDYSDMSNEDKAQVIKNIVDYAYNKAKSEITGKNIANEFKGAKNADESGYAIADYYITKSVNSKTKKSTTTDRNRYQELADKGIDGKTFDEFKHFISSVRADKDSNGNSIRGSKKQKIFDYINNLPLSATAKQNLYDDYNDNQGMFTYYK